MSTQSMPTQSMPTQTMPTHMERIGLAIVAKNGQQYGGEGDALHKTLAKVKEGWIRLE
jgi:hypothetical protein